MWFYSFIMAITAIYFRSKIADLLQAARGASTARICKRTGCLKGAFQHHEYCSRTCRKQSLLPIARPCARPGCPKTSYVSERNVFVRYDYCAKQCFHKHSDGLVQTKLVFLERDNFDFLNVRKKVKGALTITKIARIIYPAKLAKGHLTSASQMKASLKFHGTRLVCDSVCTLGTTCSDPTCCICSILQSGFVVSFIRRGPGFYFAPDAATSVAYCTANAAGTKAMFLCSVFEPMVTKAISNHTDARVALPRFLIFYK
ncbi:hypothetical protein EMPS_08641 [Entomortierella parvispora]|uniref:PARP catalytic domain-containing protein n=1 Tax=Entomortierella parvispora TaxID=205924 RepID=A0A9P3LZM6_9FUNG|nr:hypothetical protein EMPS_08641 [Entomortierella parvispora]